ncbi:MAG: hypothetical protein JXB85_16820 [Anaerolineales bacterium]|nr:hypothetical protein [Anaerolineales bacterium]
MDVIETASLCHDLRHNMLLELAICRKADAIITGNSNLLILHPFEKVAILTPDIFLNAFLSAHPGSHPSTPRSGVPSRETTRSARRAAGAPGRRPAWGS